MRVCCCVGWGGVMCVCVCVRVRVCMFCVRVCVVCVRVAQCVRVSGVCESAHTPQQHLVFKHHPCVLLAAMLPDLLHRDVPPQRASLQAIQVAVGLGGAQPVDLAVPFFEGHLRFSTRTQAGNRRAPQARAVSQNQGRTRTPRPGAQYTRMKSGSTGTRSCTGPGNR